MGIGFLVVLPLGGSWEPLSRMDDFMAEQHVPWAITDNGLGYEQLRGLARTFASTR